MEFPSTTRRQSHIHPGDFARYREIGLRDLSAPTAVLNAPWCQVKRGPELRHAADIGGGRVEKSGISSARAGSFGPGVFSMLGLVTLTAPCGGRSGLPNVAACATPPRQRPLMLLRPHSAVI
jgi:hypothetical protein